MLDYAKVKGTECGEQTINAAVRERLVTPLADAGATAIVIVVNAHLLWKDYKDSSSKFARMQGGPVDIPNESKYQTQSVLEVFRCSLC